MTKWAVYSEFDPYAAQWLRNLIAKGLIAPGEVDERNLWDVHPDDYRSFRQVHLCAGIGIWSHALRRVGWPDDAGIWSASLPCQPFSAAGKGLGFADERHLLPAFTHLVGILRPQRVVGEQVASKDGLTWLDALQSDLEGLDYAPGAVAFPAAGVGAPNLRDRLYWWADDHGVGAVADAMRSRTWNNSRNGLGAEATADGGNGGLSGQRLRPGVEGASGQLADAHHPVGRSDPTGGNERDGRGAGWAQGSGDAEGRVGADGLAFSEGQRGRPGLCDPGSTGQRGLQPGDGGSLERVDCSTRYGRIERRAQSRWRRFVARRGLGDLALPENERRQTGPRNQSFRDGKSEPAGSSDRDPMACGLGKPAGQGPQGIQDRGSHVHRQGRKALERASRQFARRMEACGVDNAAGSRQHGPIPGPERKARDETRVRVPGARHGPGGLSIGVGHGANSDGGNPGPEGLQRGGEHRQQPAHGGSGDQPAPGPVNGFWRVADWLFGRDGKWRPVEEGTFPLAHGDTNRVGGLRAYGNALNAEAAVTFLDALREDDLTSATEEPYE